VSSLLVMGLSNLLEMAWWAALSLRTRPLSPSIPRRTEGSSTDHLPLYVHSSSVPSFFACETFHLDSQSSVNCSRKGALRLVGWRSGLVLAHWLWLSFQWQGLQ
jgi:hypothetical protein